MGSDNEGLPPGGGGNADTVRETLMHIELLIVALLLCLAFCLSAQADIPMRVQGESLIFVGTKPANLCFDQVVPGSLKLRSTYSARKEGSLSYEEGRDYVVDYAHGTITRTAASRLPDYTTNCLYGQKDFDHTKFPGFSNHKWFVWADYRTTDGKPWAQPNDQSRYLKAVRAKLQQGGPFKIATYGDSITAGGEASITRYRFQWRYAHYLRTQFPKADITVQDVSISGYATRQGLDWFDKYLGSVDKPDLALVGFGMNDHNKGGESPESFCRNLVQLVKMIRERKGAEVILFSAFPPNEDWHYGSHRMKLFAEATRRAAAEAGCAYVDVFGTWEMVLKRKDQSSLLGNNINHPNDFGHWLYEQAFEAMKL